MVGVGLGARAGAPGRVLGEHRRKAHAQLAFVVDRDHAPLPEVRMLPHLLGREHRRDGRARGREPLDRDDRAASAAHAAVTARLAFFEPIEAIEVREVAEPLDAEPVAHGLPEVVLRDHAESDPTAVGAAEHAVTGRAAASPRSRPRIALPERGPIHDATTSAIATSMRSPSPVRSRFAHAAQIASAATVAAARSAIGTFGICGSSAAFARVIAPASA